MSQQKKCVDHEYLQKKTCLFTIQSLKYIKTATSKQKHKLKMMLYLEEETATGFLCLFKNIRNAIKES
ncbi:CLUMA_CG006701, isoform A [Clunio marinus]|uniref:CLUMA_CG006701, isoform A n=1 Tax=Clunio marinus TaxID=568069 RepID=A0A1J1HYN7_9DIPT|nr:CLUMA_CG006701, isoform A [Clunio marinus]